MKRLARILIATTVVLLVGSMSATGAHAGARHFGHGPHVGFGVWLGPGWWPYHYPSYYYPYYHEPPIVIQQQPEVYEQPVPEAEEQQVYWYYCKEPQGYYPYVKQCPSGWTKVVPFPPPPSTGK